MLWRTSVIPRIYGTCVYIKNLSHSKSKWQQHSGNPFHMIPGQKYCASQLEWSAGQAALLKPRLDMEPLDNLIAQVWEYFGASGWSRVGNRSFKNALKYWNGSGVYAGPGVSSVPALPSIWYYSPSWCGIPGGHGEGPWKQRSKDGTDNDQGGGAALLKWVNRRPPRE